MANPNFGIKVAKKGEDATSTDPRKFLIWSKYPNYEVAFEGTGMLTIAAEGSTDSLTVTHNLGSTPQVLFYISEELTDPVDSGNRFKVYALNMLLEEGALAYSATLDANDVNSWTLTVYRAYSDPAAPSYYFYKYYIFKNGF